MSEDKTALSVVGEDANAPIELNRALSQFIMDQMEKISRYFLSKQEGTEKAKTSNATVSLTLCNFFYEKRVSLNS